MEYYSTKKRNGLSSHKTWMNLKCIVLSMWKKAIWKGYILYHLNFSKLIELYSTKSKHQMYAKEKLKWGRQRDPRWTAECDQKNLNVLQIIKTISLKRVGEKGADQRNFGNGVCKSKAKGEWKWSHSVVSDSLAKGTVHKDYTPVYQVAAHRSAG